jgi:cyclase
VLGTLEAINRMIEMTGPNTKVVPGHGPVADQAALIAHRDLIVTVRDRISKAITEGKTLEQIRAMRPTAEFEERVGGPPAFIPQFVDTLYNELTPAR